MRGRFVVSDSISELLGEFVDEFETPRASYNVAPRSPVTIARTWETERAATVWWGFVPSWAQGFAKQKPEPINAGIETEATSPMFRRAFASAHEPTDYEVTHDVNNGLHLIEPLA